MFFLFVNYILLNIDFFVRSFQYFLYHETILKKIFLFSFFVLTTCFWHLIWNLLVHVFLFFSILYKFFSCTFLKRHCFTFFVAVTFAAVVWPLIFFYSFFRDVVTSKTMATALVIWYSWQNHCVQMMREEKEI